jgi:uncharacterized protein (DUF952 family)
MNKFILHTTSRVAWVAAQKNGAYAADTLESQGFIHFAGQHGLVLLVIDPARLTSELRWEPGVDLATELFPHIYGALNLDAVVNVLDFEPDADGRFHLPAALTNNQ